MFGDDKEPSGDAAVSPAARIELAGGGLPTEAEKKEAAVKAATALAIETKAASRAKAEKKPKKLKVKKPKITTASKFAEFVREKPAKKPAKAKKPKAKSKLVGGYIGGKTGKPTRPKKPAKTAKALDRSKATGTGKYSFCVSFNRKLMKAIDAAAKKKTEGKRSPYLEQLVAKALGVKLAG